VPITIEQLELLTQAYLAFHQSKNYPDPKTRDYEVGEYEPLVRTGCLIRAFVNDEDADESEEQYPIVAPHEHGTVLFITRMGRDVIDAILSCTKILD
jgi:hypothetical protein